MSGVNHDRTAHPMAPAVAYALSLKFYHSCEDLYNSSNISMSIHSIETNDTPKESSLLALQNTASVSGCHPNP